jgi:hypothetical protein
MDDATSLDDSPCSFEEFKLYYESTERVTERRLAANRWNYSISVAILVAVAGIYSWAAGNEDYAFVAGLVILFLTAVATLFCVFWLRQVEDWKALNAAKFTVLNDMASRIEFRMDEGPTHARSFRPFDREWEILQRKDSLRRVRLSLGRIEALNASGAELFMPRAFAAMFALVFIGTLIALITTWSSISHTVWPT